jgi:hypothetical protein
MSEYLLVAKKYDEAKRGAYTTGVRFAEAFRGRCEFRETTAIGTGFDRIEGFRKVVLVTQAPRLYAQRVNFVSLRGTDHLIYIRPNLNNPLFNSCTNGFYIYKDNPGIRHFVPMITDLRVDRRADFDVPALGFYSRVHVNYDSYLYFQEFLRGLRMTVDLYTMGNSSTDFARFPCVRSWTHTTDNVEFFSNISHYVYPRSLEYLDPFPNSLLEAAQNGIEVVVPSLGRRTFRDGIDDLQEFVRCHERFDPDAHLSNAGMPLTLENFRGFYERVLDAGFENSFDRRTHATFREWCEAEL